MPDISGKRRLFVEQRRTKKAVSPALAENRTDLARFFLLIELDPIAAYYVDWQGLEECTACKIRQIDVADDTTTAQILHIGTNHALRFDDCNLSRRSGVLGISFNDALCE